MFICESKNSVFREITEITFELAKPLRMQKYFLGIKRRSKFKWHAGENNNCGTIQNGVLALTGKLS